MDIYRERAHFVAFLSKMFPATMWADEREPNYTVIGIETLAGQLSWHIAPEDMDLFAHVTEEGHWDGHTTEQKYERLDQIGGDFAELITAILPSIDRVLGATRASGA